MTTLYLHIGTPKTGTTSIQRFLYENNIFLEKQGYVYPDFGTSYYGVGKARNAHFLVLREKKFDKNYADALKIIEGVGMQYDNIIMSDESLWNNPKNLKHFVEDMKHRNIKVKIIVYLRRQDLYVQSNWAQSIKDGIIDSKFNEYVKNIKINLNYYKCCCKFRDIVGKDNIIVREFEKQQFIDNNLLADFCYAVGLRYEREVIEKQTIKNQKLCGIYLDIKRRLNNYSEFITIPNFIVPYLNKIEKERGKDACELANTCFTYQEQLEFISKYAEGNKTLAQEFLGREDGILFREEIIKNDCTIENYKIENYIDVLSRIILKQQDEIKHLKNKYSIDKEKKEKYKENFVIDEYIKLVDRIVLKQQDRIKKLENKNIAKSKFFKKSNQINENTVKKVVSLFANIIVEQQNKIRYYKNEEPIKRLNKISMLKKIKRKFYKIERILKRYIKLF